MNTTKVGIPRALFIISITLFGKLLKSWSGNCVVGSYNKTIMDEGSKTCIDEACLPIKIFTDM